MFHWINEEILNLQPWNGQLALFEYAFEYTATQNAVQYMNVTCIVLFQTIPKAVMLHATLFGQSAYCIHTFYRLIRLCTLHTQFTSNEQRAGIQYTQPKIGLSEHYYTYINTRAYWELPYRICHCTKQDSDSSLKPNTQIFSKKQAIQKNYNTNQLLVTWFHGEREKRAIV